MLRDHAHLATLYYTFASVAASAPKLSVLTPHLVHVTQVMDLTGFELCNASLLDESTAAAEVSVKPQDPAGHLPLV